MKIYAPVENATGTWASVRFVNGVGETDNPTLIQWFIDHGYKVESMDIPSEEEHLNRMCEDIEKDFESMTPLELREWAKENGLGDKIKSIRNKEKLLEIVKG